MLSNPNQQVDTRNNHQQGLILGEAIAAEVNNGYTVTDVLTKLLVFDPKTLLDAASIVRMQGRAEAAG